MDRLLNLKISNIFLFEGVLRHNLTLKDEQKSSKTHFFD